MLANQTTTESDLHNSQDWSSVPIPAEATAAAQLQLLASSHVVDLATITKVIASDGGLTIRLVQCSAKKFGRQAATMESLGEIVVQLGLEQLRTLAAEAALTPVASISRRG